MDRGLEGLADEVPQGDVDAALRCLVADGAVEAGVDERTVEGIGAERRLGEDTPR